MEKRPYNSRILFTFIKFINHQYSNVNIKEVLEYCGLEMYQIEDPECWLTQEQVDLFYEKVRAVTKNDHIARDAGRFVTSQQAAGFIGQYIWGFSGPRLGYELISKIVPRITLGAKYESKRLDKNSFEITVTPYKDINEKQYQCENRMGFFEGVALYFGNKMPQIEHPECIYNGDKHCRYLITWASTKSDMWKQIRNIAGVASVIGLALSSFYRPDMVGTLLPWIASVIAILVAMVYKLEKKELEKATSTLRSTSEQLMDQGTKNYNNLLAINEIGLALSKQIQTSDILNNVVEVLRRRLEYERGMILLANKERTRLDFKAGYGYTVQMLDSLRKTSFHLDKTDSKGTFIRCFHEQKPFLVDNIEEEISNLSSRSIKFAQVLAAQSFICCPIVYENETMGVIAVDNVISKRPLLQSDINLLLGITPEIGISIHNFKLVETGKQQFHSILATLAASIDARDEMTAGHSEKVTEYAVAIAKTLGLSDDVCEMIRVAAALHDYGKIGIDDNILKKPGKLTPEEFSEIKKHAQKTIDILSRINFEGIYKDVPLIAGCHHEKLDGSGYPYGLKGENIPLGAKIIAVADFFEAVTARRHYRAPMPIGTAFAMLEEVRNKHYEGKIIDAFIKSFYFRKEDKNGNGHSIGNSNGNGNGDIIGKEEIIELTKEHASSIYKVASN